MARPKQISDSELLDAARKVFLKHGAKVPVSTIAEELGVTAAALFHRVGSKSHLLAMALEPSEPPVIALMKGGYRQGAPADAQMVDFLMGMADYLDTAVASVFCLREGGVLPGKRKGNKNYPGKLRQAMAKWLKQAQARGDVRKGDAKIMAEALMGTIEIRFTVAYLSHMRHSRASDRAFITRLVREILHRA